MKRPPNNFSVEYKRRPRAAEKKPASIWSDVLQEEFRAGSEEHEAVDASGASAAPARTAVPRVKAAAAPRILDAVVADMDERQAGEEDAEAADAVEPAPRRMRERRRKAVAASPVAAGRDDVADRHGDDADAQTVEDAEAIEDVAAPSGEGEGEGNGGPAFDEAPDEASEPAAERPLAVPGSSSPGGYRERRRAAKHGLKLGERWKRAKRR